MAAPTEGAPAAAFAGGEAAATPMARLEGCEMMELGLGELCAARRAVLLALAIAFLSGLLVSPFLPEGVKLPLGVVSLGVAAILGLGGRELGARLWIVPLASAALLAGLSHRTPSPPSPLPPGIVRLDAEVLSVRHDRRGPTADLSALEGSWVEDSERRIPEGTPLRLRGVDAAEGARITLLGRITPATRPRNPTPHPRWRPLAPQSAWGRAIPGSVEVERPADPFSRAIHRARGSVRRALAKSLSPRASGMARALTLGDGGAPAEEDREVVRGAGLAHVLAVSGLHVGLVVGIVFLAIERLLLRFEAVADPRRWAAALTIGVAPAYAALAGASASASRAAIMASLALAMTALGRRPNVLAILAAAILVHALTHPLEVHAPGFLLSIAATAALTTMRWPTGAQTWRARVGLGLSASTRALFATAPITIYCFSQLSLVGLIANVILVPLGALVLVPLCGAHALLATLLPSCATLTAPVVEACVAAFVAASGLFAALGGFWNALPPPTVAQGAVVACTSLSLLVFTRRRTRLLVAAAGLLSLFLLDLDLRAREQPRGALRLTVLDVGQGDAMLLDLPDGALMAIDAGGAIPDMGERMLLPLLAARRRRSIDTLVLTHPHPDHYGGMASLLQSLDVGEVWDSGQAIAETPEGEVARMLEDATRRGVEIRDPRALCARPRHHGGAVVEVLSPCPAYDPGHGPNDNSLVISIRFGKRRLLLTGDLERASEQALLERGRDLRADFLKVGHHGSRTSSTAAFLDAVRPRWAAISCGAHNRFGHPSPSVLAALKHRSARIFRTDVHGGITVRTDGKGMVVEPYLSSRPRLMSDTPRESRRFTVGF